MKCCTATIVYQKLIILRYTLHQSKIARANQGQHCSWQNQTIRYLCLWWNRNVEPMWSECFNQALKVESKWSFPLVSPLSLFFLKQSHVILSRQHCRHYSSSHLVSLSGLPHCCHSLLPPQVSLSSPVGTADTKQQVGISIINSSYWG